MNQVTEYIKVSRDTIINQLTQSFVDHLEMNPDDIEGLCKWGFKGFENMHNDELIENYREYISEDPEYNVVIELEN